MSALDAHAKAARVMGHCFAARGEKLHTEGCDETAAILVTMAEAYFASSDAIEQLIRDECKASEAHCSIDHRTITVPKCPACGAPKTR